MKQNSKRSKSSPGAQSHSGGRSPLARQAAARVLQAAANRRAFNAQILAQQTPAASAAQELGITPTVTTADALDGGIGFSGNAADPGTTLQVRGVARTAIRGLSGTPYTVDQMVKQYEAYTAVATATAPVPTYMLHGQPAAWHSVTDNGTADYTGHQCRARFKTACARLILSRLKTGG